MGKPQKRKSKGNNNEIHRKKKTKFYKRDLDQIYEDVKPQNAQKFEKMPIDEDLPGFGQYYCIACARHFQNKEALQQHLKTKIHKQQLKRLKEEPYTIEEAESYGK